jgi:hypothetical protein
MRANHCARARRRPRPQERAVCSIALRFGLTRDDENLPFKDQTDFVPKGLDEGSLARSAWKIGRYNPSRRERYELGDTACSPPKIKEPHRQTIIPYPTGRNHFCAIPGTSCQATLVQSLRDDTKLQPSNTPLLHRSTSHNSRTTTTTRTSTRRFVSADPRP